MGGISVSYLVHAFGHGGLLSQYNIFKIFVWDFCYIVILSMTIQYIYAISRYTFGSIDWMRE